MNLGAAVSAIAEGLHPPLAAIASHSDDTFDYSHVDLQDGDIVWRVVRERSVLEVRAMPVRDSSEWFEARRLRRFFGLSSPASAYPRGSVERLKFLMNRSVEDVMRELQELRPLVAAAFDNGVWPRTHEALQRLREPDDPGRAGRLASGEPGS